MNSVLIFYVTFFFIINGEPVIIQDFGNPQPTYEKCTDYANTELLKVYPILIHTPESYVTATCLHRYVPKEMIH